MLSSFTSEHASPFLNGVPLTFVAFVPSERSCQPAPSLLIVNCSREKLTADDVSCTH